MTRATFRFACGFALSVALCVAVAEAYVTYFPPNDLHSYLGEQSPLTGHYAPDDDFTIGYRTWDDFYQENAERLSAYLGSNDSRPTWAFFGNSFVQAPGMLADCARANVSERRVFNLGRNEKLYLRFAQIKLLLDHGLTPERIFVALMPVDVIGLGQQPLSTLHVTGRGAITFQSSAPPSRIALTTWVRLGWAGGNPSFNQSTLYDRIDEPLLSDIRALFSQLAQVTQRRQIPVTVLLIPAYHQICKGTSFTFQDTLGAIFREQGFDVFDPREVFCKQPDLAGLFIPDKHFSRRGNEILLRELVKHVRQSPQKSDAIAGAP